MMNFDKTFKKSFSGGFCRAKKSKGIAGILILFVAIFLIVTFLFIFGIAGNYGKRKAEGNDIIGIGSFFLALTDTVNQFLIMGNLLIWTLLFFVVQGVFLFAYYMMAKFIWVHVPEYQKLFERMKQRLSVLF
jgi:uncharacterized membrane protein